MKGLKILLLMLLVTVIKAQQYASVSEDGLEDTGKKHRLVDKLMSKTFLGGDIWAFTVNYMMPLPSFFLRIFP